MNAHYFSRWGIAAAILLTLLMLGGMALAAQDPVGTREPAVDRSDLDGWVIVPTPVGIEIADGWVVATADKPVAAPQIVSFAEADRQAGYPTTPAVVFAADGWVVAAQEPAPAAPSLSFAQADHSAGYPEEVTRVATEEPRSGVGDEILLAMLMLAIGVTGGAAVMHVIDARGPVHAH